DEGTPVRVVEYDTEYDEAREIASAIALAVHEGQVTANGVAIFYRTNALSRVLEHALRAEQLPYQIVRGVEFYRRKEVKDILAYLQLLVNPRNDVAFLRVINAPPRGIGRVSLQRLREFADGQRQCLLDAAQDAEATRELPTKAAKSVRDFAQRIRGLTEAAASLPLDQIVGQVLEQSGYAEHLRESHSEEDQQRLENTEELLSAARDFQNRFPDAHLADFLEQSSLAGDTDDWDSAAERVSLMTLHAAKGLEFPHVYIVAAERNILPHERSLNDADAYEEERRLMFVGLTRAERQLQISCVRRREYRGTTRTAIPSDFIHELGSAYTDFQRMGSALDLGETAASSPLRDNVLMPRVRLPRTAPIVPSDTRTAPRRHLMTAEQLLRQQSPEPAPVPTAHDAAMLLPIELGMVVRHPK
ncbi:MAG TPA: 3'-5' exonuclease, partial [Pirellulaceae bacterium]